MDIHSRNCRNYFSICKTIRPKISTWYAYFSLQNLQNAMQKMLQLWITWDIWQPIVESGELLLWDCGEYIEWGKALEEEKK